MNLLSTQQAAEKLGVSERRVRSLITEGKLVAHRLGRDYAIEENVLSNVLVYGTRGRPKKPDEGETAAQAASVTAQATSARPKKTVAGKGTAAAETKPAAKKRSAKAKTSR